MIQTTCCGCWVEWWRPTLQNLYFNVVFRKSQNNGESANTHPKTGLFWGSVSTFSYPRILVFLPLRVTDLSAKKGLLLSIIKKEIGVVVGVFFTLVATDPNA